MTMAARTAKTTKPLWTCPRCGQTFVTENLWHSCAVVPLNRHFGSSPPELRRAFDRIVALAQKNGPIAVRPVKTRIALQANTRFASVTVRKKTLTFGVILDHAKARPPVTKVEKFGKVYGHYCVIENPTQVGAGVARMLREAYALDRKRHGPRRA